MKNIWQLAVKKQLVGSEALMAVVIVQVMFAGGLYAQTPQSSQQPVGPDQVRAEASWRESMRQVAIPNNKRACFAASYPQTTWSEVACATPPNQPYPFRRGFSDPNVVGNGTDYSAEVPNLINGATGSFSGVTGVTSESGNVNGNPPPVANTFSLQLNSKPFPTTLCNGSPNQFCQGWQQFVYSNSGVAFIQYWLLNYNTTCPAGYNTYGTDCWRNGPNGVSVPPQPITNLPGLSLTGTANSNGTDTVIMAIPGGTMGAANVDSILNLASGWNGVEFVLVGDCCSSQAIFNAGSTTTVTTTVHHGSTTNAPTCILAGYTGETNNLTLVATAAIGIQPSPAILSTQSNIAGLPPSCVTANGWGDTHLTTFSNLFYDFQSAGDFLLAETGPDFIVQARQISGRPSWPNASVNQAVATRMGATEVAVCLPKDIDIDRTPKLEVDRNLFHLDDGKSVMQPDGVFISRRGNVYLVSDQSGNSLRAQLVNPGVVNQQYINAWVGLGRWPVRVFGLLANATGSADEIAPRYGTALKAPFNFEDLYYRYGRTWRVTANEDLLLACGEATEQGEPRLPLTVKDLPATEYARARAVCIAAGVKDEALLQACSIDVVVLKDDKAAEVFAHAPAPSVVGNKVQP
jgi:hypothetical protein